jgi:hypothetical protein
MFLLKFETKEIERWAGRYRYRRKETAYIEQVLAPRVRRRRYYRKREFLRVCAWKTRRSQPECAKNSPAFVQEITEVALGQGASEEMRIRVLTLLAGVGWPTASVILHFGTDNRYPILDRRVLWSLGFAKPPPYEYDLWRSYVVYCRRLASSCDVSLRTLDKALWQYSKKNQMPGKP